MPPTQEDRGLCLSMHQPWASFLVHGIKRIEGRGWPTEHRGRLWIHATSKQPTPEEVEELETFYKGVHAMEGNEVTFPAEYPTSVLLGCVDVVNCLTAEQVEGWEGLPASLKLEVGSPYCFLCERPQRLVVLHQMRGWPKLFELEKKMLRIASLGLKPPPSSSKITWAAFGQPPPANIALPRSANKHRFSERMAGEGAQKGSSEAEKVARGEGSLSPRAAIRATATAGSKGAGSGGPAEEKSLGAGIPRAVALRQQQGQQQGQGSTVAAEEERVQQDPAKRLRAVQKKLRQIAALEEKRERVGAEALTAEEQEKLERAAQLQAEEAALQQQLA